MLQWSSSSLCAEMSKADLPDPLVRLIAAPLTIAINKALPRSASPRAPLKPKHLHWIMTQAHAQLKRGTLVSAGEFRAALVPSLVLIAGSNGPLAH